MLLKLLPQLKNKGYKIAVAKHCPVKFDLDIEGKDTWNFTQAGAQGIFLSSPDEEAIIRPAKNLSDIGNRLQEYFTDFDLVLMEGYNEQRSIKKIQIIRQGVGGEAISSGDTIAYISDTNLNTDKPVYKPEDLSGIISFLESLINQK